MKKLDAGEVEKALQNAPGWTVTGGVLRKEWSFPDFVEAMKFVNRVAEIAEDAGHHPDIDIRYNKVKLALVSHDAGGLTEKDFDLARKADEISTKN